MGVWGGVSVGVKDPQDINTKGYINSVCLDLYMR